MENGCSYPDQAVLKNAKEHDYGQLEVLVDNKECMYVFDRGYFDRERFDRIFFFARMRSYARWSTWNCQKIHSSSQMKWWSSIRRRIGRYLKASLWKIAHIWLRKIEGKSGP